MKKIKEAVGSSSEIFGIKIIDVRIMRADLPKENSDAIFARMQTEREKEAREIRAKGAEEADKIRAEANKQKTIILAEAKKNSDIVRGNGESESNRIYANSFGKDPEFADFYRSMSAYKTAFSNDKTKMIISPDSDFFKYFNNSKN
jgi:membrane protease subunit HflC